MPEIDSKIEKHIMITDPLNRVIAAHENLLMMKDRRIDILEHQIEAYKNLIETKDKMIENMTAQRDNLQKQLEFREGQVNSLSKKLYEGGLM